MSEIIPGLERIKNDRISKTEAKKKEVLSVPLHERPADDDEDDRFVLPVSVPWTKGFKWEDQPQQEQRQQKGIADSKAIGDFESLLTDCKKSVASADAVAAFYNDKLAQNL